MGMPGIEGPWVAPIFTAGAQRPDCHPQPSQWHVLAVMQL